MSHFVGIDLGTTNSAACVSDGKDVRVVRAAQGGNLTPSVIRIDARGHVLIGERARKYLSSDPDNTRAEFKRLMGTEHRLAFAAAGVDKSPEELSSLVLGALRSDVERTLGFAPEQAVITVPALFELPQSRATSDAARLAGFSRVELIQEPVASALAAGWSSEQDGNWLVYDLGGGTFDVTLLEPRDGLLRVVGHDGDNFLGGRDMDAGVMEFVLAELAAQNGITIDVRDPTAAAGLRRLRTACEEAKLDAALGSGDLLVGLSQVSFGGDPIEVDVVMPRAQFDGLVRSIAARTLLVCERLLARAGLRAGELDSIVLVGGPTNLPLLRQVVSERLGAALTEGIDPMTLVAQGAARYAATSGLDARGPQKASTSNTTTSAAQAPLGVNLWLQFPAVTSDRTPFVVGRLVEPNVSMTYAHVVFTRVEDGVESAPEAFDAEGAFAAGLELFERASTEFRCEVVDRSGKRHPAKPSHITIQHGVTIGDPPLARTIGVAREDGDVTVFFERGIPLPAKRTHTMKTAIPLGGGYGGCLEIPIVQGEFPFANLCRAVGRISIQSDAVGQAVAPGTEVEIELALDTAGALRAHARIAGITRVFDGVLELLSKKTSSADLRAGALGAQTRLAELYAGAAPELQAQLHTCDAELVEVLRGADLGEGGDADALERARRRLGEVEEKLHTFEAARGWPELTRECEEWTHDAALWVGQLGNKVEQQSLEQLVAAISRCLRARDAAGAKRYLQQVRALSSMCYFRDPEAWPREFAYYAARVAEAYDLPAAHAAVVDGKAAIAARRTDDVKAACLRLKQLLPSAADARARSLGSGVR